MVYGVVEGWYPDPVSWNLSVMGCVHVCLHVFSLCSNPCFLSMVYGVVGGWCPDPVSWNLFQTWGACMFICMSQVFLPYLVIFQWSMAS